MYYFFMDKLPLPVAPQSLTISYGGMNKTYDMIDDGEINILKPSKLQDISFDFLLPGLNYSFVQSAISQSTWLNKLKKMKKDKKPFQFIVVRQVGNSFNFKTFTNVKVSLEEYSIKEDAGNGVDMTVSVTLKEWKPYGTKKVKVEGDTATVENDRETTNSPAPTENTLMETDKNGSLDTLWKVAKSTYGSGDLWSVVAQANDILNVNEYAGMASVILPKVVI